MGVLHNVQEVVEHSGAEQVYGHPISHNAITVLPVAKVSGGGGGGDAPALSEQAEGGSGGGLGIAAKPLGVFVIRDDHVAWRPAIDINRAILGGQIVAIVALLVLRSVLKARRKSAAL